MLLLSTRDGTLEHIKIVNDTAQHLESGKVKGIINHFDKAGRGWIEKGTGKTYYLAYTGLAKTVAINEPEMVDKGFGVCLKEVLGEEMYSKIIPEIKTKVEATNLHVLVEPIAPTKEELQGASNEARHSESDERMIDYYAKKVSDALKSKFEWTNVLLGAFAGGMLVYVAVNMHWLKVA